jgi:nitrite reductase (NO-forming)
VKSKFSFGLTTIALGAALALTACGGGGSTEPTPPPPANFTVGALDAFKFDPETLSVKAGEQVTVVLDNKGVLEHNFVIDEFSVSVGPIAGATKSTPHTFTPTTAGTYTYYCNVPGHKEAGMIGTLTVNP